jgi:DNA polymerase-1
MESKLAAYRTIWLVDFEFQAPPGQIPTPICVVARELRSGKLERVWLDGVDRPAPPYSTDADSLFVAYFSSAEWNCHLALNWPLPPNILDLYVEFVWLTNSPLRRYNKSRESQIAALNYFGCPHIGAGPKEKWRKRIMDGPPWSPEERTGILDYCQSDIRSMEFLLEAMLLNIELPSALHRGQFSKCIARMEHTGLPIDVDLFRLIRGQGPDIREALIADYESAHQFQIYEGARFRMSGFEDFLLRERIAWPRLPSGLLATSDSVFKDQAAAHPKVAKLRELRRALTGLRDFKMAVGDDGRNRTLLGAFGTITSRNAPKAGQFLFGAAAWQRALLKPAEGMAVAYLDWGAQEIAIAAFLSQDPALQAAYRASDIYISFGQASSYLPSHANKTTHPAERELLKQAVLGINYGMQENTLAQRINKTPTEARDILRRHRETYPVFWKWVKQQQAQAFLSGEIRTPFGWRMLVNDETKSTTLQNWPMQSLGAEMMRLGIEMLQAKGITVCCPVHDAVVIESELADFDDVVEVAKQTMADASQIVMNGQLTCRVDGTSVRWPDRYQDKRPEAVEMWTRATRLLGVHQRTPTGALTLPRVISNK